MGSSEDIILTIVGMLDEKYSREKNVTIQRIFDKFSTRLVKGRQITIYLSRIGILKPRHDNETVKEANLWEIDFDKVEEFLEHGGALMEINCPLCGGETISSKYNSFRCKRCFFEGSLTEENNK